MLAPVVSVSVLLLGVGLVTAWYVERLQENAAAILVQNVASIRAVEELEIGLRKVRSRVNTFRLTGDRTYLQQIPGLREQTDQSLEDAIRLGSTEREQELMEKVSRGYERFFAECEKLAALAAESGRHEEQWALVNDVLQRIWILRKVLNELNPTEAMELLVDRLSKTKNNGEFLSSMNKVE
jgi:CHASE3 domain sensor protein